MLLVNNDYPMCHWEIMEYLKGWERTKNRPRTYSTKKYDTSNKDRVLKARERMLEYDIKHGYK